MAAALAGFRRPLDFCMRVSISDLLGPSVSILLVGWAIGQGVLNDGELVIRYLTVGPNQQRNQR
jgi:hypothetical protein